MLTCPVCGGVLDHVLAEHMHSPRFTCGCGEPLRLVAVSDRDPTAGLSGKQIGRHLTPNVPDCVGEAG